MLVLTVVLTAVLVAAMLAWRDRALLHDAGRLAVRLVKHPEVPRPLRWLMVIAVLPIPGPVDELLGGVAVLLLLRVRPGLVSGVWREIRVERAS